MRKKYFRHLFLLFTMVLLVSSTDSFAKKKDKKKKKSTQKVEEKDADKEAKAELLFIKGEGKFISDDFTAAVTYFEEALALSPDNSAIHYKLAQCNYALGTTNRAINHAVRAIDLEPDVKEYYTLLIDIYLHEKQFEDAAGVYEKLLINVKNSGEYYYEVAGLYQDIAQNELSKLTIYKQSEDAKRMKEIEESYEQHLLKAVEHYNSFEAFYGITPDVIYKKEAIYLKLNNVDAAVLEAEKLSDANPKVLSYKLKIAELYKNNNQNEKAIVVLEEISQDYPGELEVQFMLAEYYKDAGQQEKANEIVERLFRNKTLGVDDKVKLISALIQGAGETKLKFAHNLCEIVLEIHPKEAPAHAVFGDVLYLMENKEAARNEYYKAVIIDSTRYLIWQQIVFIDSELKQNDSLLKHTNEALVLFNYKPVLWFYNGIAHQLLKNDSAAVLAYEQGVGYAESLPELQEQFYAQLGDSYFAVGEKEKAYKSYDEVLVVNPNNIHVLNNYAYFLATEKEQLKKARSMSSKVVMMNPNDATYLDTYAWVLYQLGEYKEAKQYLEKALETTTDGTVLEHYGDVLFQMGKVNEAVDYWVKAKEQGGTSDKIDEKITEKRISE